MYFTPFIKLSLKCGWDINSKLNNDKTILLIILEEKNFTSTYHLIQKCDEFLKVFKTKRCKINPFIK